MKKEGKMITILLADDDPDDRTLTHDAFMENRLANEFHAVEDGEELLAYLYRRGKYESLRGEPLPGLILPRPKYAAQRWARARSRKVKV